MNKRTILLYLMVLSIFCLTGCGKNKVTESDSYIVEEITEIQISIDTWNLSVMASSDEQVHISFDGSISDDDVKPTASLQNNVLTIAQKSDEDIENQLALGKKGQLTLYLPTDFTIPIVINNGIGDIEADSISATKLQLVNSAGYVTLSNFVTDNLEISSTSGDITVKGSDIDNVAIVTTSGYVNLSSTNFRNSEIVTKSGEINMSEISPDTNISLQTGSGDINLNYQTSPDNLDFAVSSGSKDITTRFNGATYDKETTSCRQGMIGEGQNKLKVNSDNGTVIIK